MVNIIFVAVGNFLYLPPDMVLLAREGAMQAVSQKTRIAFPRVKVAFDTSMVLISAVLVGTVLSFIMKLFRERLDKFLNDDYEVICYERECNAHSFQHDNKLCRNILIL